MGKKQTVEINRYKRNECLYDKAKPVSKMLNKKLESVRNTRCILNSKTYVVRDEQFGFA